MEALYLSHWKWLYIAETNKYFCHWLSGMYYVLIHYLIQYGFHQAPVVRRKLLGNVL